MRTICTTLLRFLGVAGNRACIEPEWSVTSMIDAEESATRTVCCGLAAATASIVIAASASAVGSTRRHSCASGSPRSSVSAARASSAS